MSESGSPDKACVGQLLEQANRVCRLFKKQARRAFILELAGTPKAGKTTTLGVLKDFLKQAGFRVSIMRERAADCPVPMKGHFFFNAWTSATMLAQVLGELDTQCDVLILDRGFFDSLVWLELQYDRGQVTDEEKNVFERFMLLDRWCKLTNLTVVLRAEPEVAMRRENLCRLVPRTGSIMNEEALTSYNQTLDKVARAHSGGFEFAKVSSVGSHGVLQTSFQVLEQVLRKMEAWVDPKILAVPKAVVTEGLSGKETLLHSECDTFLSCAASRLVSKPRSLLENDAEHIQLVASAAFRHDGKYVLIERSAADPKSQKFGSRTLWHRCHVEARDGDDPRDATALLEAAGAQMRARIRDDLHLSQLGELEHRGALWSRRQDEGSHLGLAFVVDIDDADTAESLSTKEFRRGKRAPLLRTEYYTRGELIKLDNLETWSRNAARDGLLEDAP